MALTTHNLHSNRLHHSTTMPQSKADDTTQHAATISYNRSPTLIRASSSRFPTSPFCTCLAWFLAFVVPSLFYIGPSLLLLPPLLYFYVSTKASLVAAAVNVFLVAYPHKPWPRFRSIFQLWYSLFDFHHNLNLNGNGMTEPATLTEKESRSLLICAMHPHGVIPIQAFLWMAFCDQYLPASYGFGAAADVAMRIPLIRQILCWGSAGSASRNVLYKGLANDQNLFILPGGVAEIFSSQPGTHVAKASRRGLMKLALQTGASLVPVYVFGGNDFYHQIGHEEISRKHKAALTIFWGQCFTPMPFPVKCSMVLGDPIPPVVMSGDVDNRGAIQKIPEPSAEQIEELLSRYMNALCRLFDQYKAQAGYPNAELEIR